MPKINTQLPIEPVLEQMAGDIKNLGLENPMMVGIHSGGAWIAEHLHKTLKVKAPLGSLDISFYRDDFSRVGLNPNVKSSHLPESIDDRNVILVDDVLHTGRTIRAALNEIFSYGRPASVRLAVALDRPGRELPIQADIIGQTMNLGTNQQAKLANDKGKLIFHLIDTNH